MGVIAASRVMLSSIVLLALAVAGCNLQSAPPAKQVESEQAKPAGVNVDINYHRPPVPASTPTPNDEHEESDDPFSEVVEQEHSIPLPLDNTQGDSATARITRSLDDAHLLKIEVPPDALTFNTGSEDETLVVGYRDGSIKFHDIVTWEVRQELTGAEFPILAIDLTADGKQLVSAGGDDDHAELKLWDLTGEKPAQSLPPPEYAYALSEVAISPDGKYVLSNNFRTELVSLDDSQGRRYFGAGTSASNFRRLMKFSPDGKYAVLVDGNGEAEVVEMKTFEDKEFRAVSRCADHALVIDADGQGFIVADSRGQPFRSWDFDGNPRIEYAPPKNGIASLALTPDGKYLIGGGGGYGGKYPIRIWERASGRVVAEWEAHKSQVSRIMLARGGEWIVSQSWDHAHKTIHVWSLEQALKQHAFEEAEKPASLTARVTSAQAYGTGPDACLSSDANFLYLIDSEKVKVQDLRHLVGYNSLHTLTKLLPDGAPYFDGVSEMSADDEAEHLTHLELSADDATLLTANGKHAIAVWDIPTFTLRTTHTLHSKLIDVLVVSPDGKSFVSADVGSSEVACRDTQSGRTKWKAKLAGGLDRLGEPIPRPVRFSRDGKSVVMAGESSVRFFDAADGSLRRTVATQIKAPTGLALSPDGLSWAVSGSRSDGSDDAEDIQLSVFRGEKRLWAQQNAENRLKVFDFSADGKCFFNALGGKNVEVRTAREGALVRKLSPQDSEWGNHWNLVAAAKVNSFVLVRDDTFVAMHLPHLLDAELLAVVDKLEARNVEIFAEGDRIMFDFGDSSATDADLAVLTKLQTPFRVRLGSNNLTDAALEHLQGLEHLVGVDLSRGKFSDEGVAHLAGLPNIREFAIDSTDGISDRSVEVIGGFTELERLKLQFTDITGSSFRHLRKLTRLRELELYAGNITPADMQHLAGLTELRLLDMSYTLESPTADTLQPLANFKKLEELNLASCELTDDAMTPIAGLRTLRTLDLSDNQITGAGCQSLAELTNLRLLQLNDNPIDDTGLAHLSKLTRLQKLDIRDTNAAGDNLAALAGMIDLRELELGRLPGFTGRDLDVLANAPRLKRLSLGGTSVGDEGVEQLAKVTQLEWLVLPPNMTDAGFAPLAKLTHLQQLRINPLAKITGEGLTHLEDLPKLWFLDLDGTQVTDDGLASLLRLQQLSYIELSSTKISDAALQHLVGLPNLERVELGYTSITDAGLAHLAKIKSLETLGLEDTPTTADARERLVRQRKEENDYLSIRD